MTTKMKEMVEVLSNANYSANYLEKNIEKSIKEKASLKELMSKSKYWNEDELAICIPIKIPTLAKNLSSICEGFVKFLVRQFTPTMQEIITTIINEKVRSSWEEWNNSRKDSVVYDLSNKITKDTLRIVVRGTPGNFYDTPMRFFVSEYYRKRISVVRLSRSDICIDYFSIIEELEKIYPNASNIFLAINILNAMFYITMDSDDLSNVSSRITPLLKDHKSNISPRLKPSRIISRLLEDISLPQDQKKELNRWLAKLGDACKTKEIERELKFSIHPFDFLTMSNTINDEGWHSCHTLDSNDQDRCYQAGVFSYMLDNVSIVAYTHVPGQHYKESRTMVFVGENRKLGCHGRIYPQGFNSREIANIYDKWLESELFFGLDKVINYETTSLSFVESREGSCQYPDYKYEYDSSAWGNIENNNIVVGSPYFYCLKCGSAFSSGGEDYPEENCYCFDCRENNYHYCYCCGERVREEDCRYIDGNCYCDTCASDME